ncbi:hypothetical protein SKAU_G00231210 [Synaphobranchus kaupii]|uniref:Formiminotransferase N-terminal subdomain domain-containing protein n=1 Tax=Synaphobranchus kaupii TaxID=118154 RepID=A0A9Q1F5W8_SYNKA|nr:hypothetical protein SKAU_G00231210 [Synaphobranchus kaupii]
MGTLDVCPFIPVQNVTMEECVTCANLFAERLSDILNVPGHLYGKAAHIEERRSLPSVRSGEYEALAEKVCPDFTE